MEKIFLTFSLVIMALVFSSCTNTKKQAEDTADKVALEMTDDGFITLFDGETFEGWRGYNRTDMPSAWTIDDGALKINGSGSGEANVRDGGDIIFDRKFKNFELTFEWKVEKGGNSGVFFLAQEVEGVYIWKSAPEYAILDNDNLSIEKLGKDNNRMSASLYGMIPAVPQNSKPFGEWNTGGIMVNQGTVVHSQNGKNVVEYHLWTDDWKQMVEGSKFKDMENFINVGGENHEGFIGFQDEVGDVWFRNIKVKVLN